MKVLFAAMFFLQRYIIITIMATQKDFGRQWSFSHMMLLLNAAYLFGVTPYLETIDSFPDYFNVVALLLLSIL